MTSSIFKKRQFLSSTIAHDYNASAIKGIPKYCRFRVPGLQYSEILHSDNCGDDFFHFQRIQISLPTFTSVMHFPAQTIASTPTFSIQHLMSLWHSAAHFSTSSTDLPKHLAQHLTNGDVWTGGVTTVSELVSPAEKKTFDYYMIFY